VEKSEGPAERKEGKRTKTKEIRQKEGGDESSCRGKVPARGGKGKKQGALLARGVIRSGTGPRSISRQDCTGATEEGEKHEEGRLGPEGGAGTRAGSRR